jgi:predicted DNA-binding protein
MSERAPARRRTAKRATTTSIHFRMPPGLHSRLRRFAEERSLGEAEALRLAVSERLNQIDDERELADAERWQFEQAYATFQRYLEGKEKLVGWKDIERTIGRALGKGRRARRHGT